VKNGAKHQVKIVMPLNKLLKKLKKHKKNQFLNHQLPAKEVTNDISVANNDFI
jgi:hypothetical protein